MSLKTLREFASESNAFDAALNEATAAGKAQTWDADAVIAWLRGCITHGRYLAPGSPEREALQALVDYWTSRLLRLGRTRSEDVDRLADFDPTAGVALLVECPYPGLEPYSERQRVSFFGREDLIRECVAHLEDPAGRIFLLIGASGSGKSSVALAGVLPELQMRHGAEWLFAPPFTPGSEPLLGLATAIAQATRQTDASDTIMPMLMEHRIDELAAMCHGKPLMLLIDQFEELFTVCRDADAQKAFGRLLTTLSAADVVGTSAWRVLLTLRTDHVARLESNEVLHPLHGRLIAEGNHRYLSAIGFADIARAIAEPAKRVGLRFVPPDLVNRLASESAGLVSGLPLLQFALRRLWDTRPRNGAREPLDLITADMVNALPDVQSALGTVAEGLFQRFTPSQQQICERLLLELVVLDENFEEPLRRRRREEELTRVLVQRRMGTAEDVATVISQFVAAGLLRQFGEGPQRQIEVAHEALLRHWDRINQLVTGQTVKERLHLVKQIGREAAEWVGRGRSESYLTLRGERLERALEYAQEDWLAEAESAEYVEASKQRQRAEHEREARQSAMEHAAERAEAERKNWRRVALAVTPLLLVLAFSVWKLARSEKQMREEQQRALGLGLAGTSLLEQIEQPNLLETSVLDAVASGRLLGEPNSGQIHALQQGLYLLPKRSWRLDHQGIVWSVAFTDDNRLVATVSEDKTVRVFAASDTTGKPIKELRDEQDVWTAAFSPKGRYLATGGAARVRLYDTTQWKEVWEFGGPASSLSFDHDGHVLAAGNPLGSAVALRVADGQTIWSHSYKDGATVFAVAFSPQERQLLAVATDDPQGGVVDTATKKVVYSFERPTRAVAFSGDGQSLVFGGSNEAHVLRFRTRLLEGPLSHARPVLAVACTRDCSSVVTGSEDNSARLFEVSSRRQIAELKHAGTVNAVAISPDGRWVATGSSDGTARVLEAADGREVLRRPNDDRRAVAAVAFSPSGTYVTTGATMFETANAYEIARVGVPSVANMMNVSPDGEYLGIIGGAAPGKGGTVRIVDLRTGKLADPPFGSRDKYIALSEAARYVLVADDRSVEVVRRSDRASILKREFPGTVALADISPDGRFAVIAEGAAVHLINTSSGETVFATKEFAKSVSSVVFSYDGRYVAVGSEEPIIWVFSVETGKPIPSAAAGLPHRFADSPCKTQLQPCRVSSLSFSRDSKRLVTASEDGTARVFDLATGREVAILPHPGQVVNVTFAREDARYVATAGQDFTGRIWDVAAKKELWHMPHGSEDFFPLQFTERDKYVLVALSTGPEVVVERHPWRLNDLLDAACAFISPQLTQGWQEHSGVPVQACPH